LYACFVPVSVGVYGAYTVKVVGVFVLRFRAHSYEKPSSYQ
jgi:hypothetical protein